MPDIVQILLILIILIAARLYTDRETRERDKPPPKQWWGQR